MNKIDKIINHIMMFTLTIKLNYFINSLFLLIFCGFIFNNYLLFFFTADLLLFIIFWVMLIMCYFILAEFFMKTIKLRLELVKINYIKKCDQIVKLCDKYFHLQLNSMYRIYYSLKLNWFFLLLDNYSFVNKNFDDNFLKYINFSVNDTAIFCNEDFIDKKILLETWKNHDDNSDVNEEFEEIIRMLLYEKMNEIVIWEYHLKNIPLWLRECVFDKEINEALLKVIDEVTFNLYFYTPILWENYYAYLNISVFLTFKIKYLFLKVPVFNLPNKFIKILKKIED